jgi:PmbA protein
VADLDDLEGLAERIAGWARDGEQVEAYVARGRHTQVKVFGGDVESLSSAESEGVGIRVVAGHRQGFAYAASLDPTVIAEVLDEARDNASFGTVDEFLGLPGPDGVAPADLDLYRPEMAAFPADRKVDLALEVERLTRAADPRIRGVETAEYGDAIVEAAVASTTGVRAASRRTACSVYAYAMAGGAEETQTGYGYSVARRPEDLDVEKAAADAARRATRLLGARKPASQRLTVVLEPTVCASFVGLLAAALNGMGALKGRSFLAGRLGEEVAVPMLTLVDDPTNPEAYGAGRFDAEGLASRRNVLLDRGVVRTFVHNTYTARRSGLASNACAVRGGFKSTPGAGTRALSLDPGQGTQADVLAAVGDGLLVQSLTGLHSGASVTTGDFSVGVEGLMVRGGEVAEPVREATIASSLPRMLAEVVAVGGDREWLPGGAAGMTLAIAGVTLSGS